MVSPRVISDANELLGHVIPLALIAKEVDTPSNVAYLKKSRRDNFRFSKSHLSSGISE